MPQDSMKPLQIEQILTFLKKAEKLKDVTRTAYTSSGKQESTAEHSWRLCLMAMLLADELGNIDLAKLLKICIIHDLGETLSGDIPAISKSAGVDKSEQERNDLECLTEPLPPPKRREILALWEEYETASSSEARLAKGLDKLETILQHNQGLNPADFEYAFNLSYGRRETAVHPVLEAIRGILDAETRTQSDR